MDRCFTFADGAQCERVEVHTFVDASDAAFAAAVYVRTVHPDDRVKVTLALSKSRLSPIRKMTIPKLELKAAVQGVLLSKVVAAALNIPVAQHHFWTNSMNVLFWVRAHSRRFATDIGVKIAEIQQVSTSKQWRHVPGKIIPADLPTCGMTATSVAKCDVW